MKLKWILFFIPIATLATTLPALSNYFKATTFSELDPNPKIQKAAPDSTQGLAPGNGMNELNVTGWDQRPGQMPVFIPDSTLTEAMPIYPAPDVDSKMIIPMGTNSDDTTSVPKKP